MLVSRIDSGRGWVPDADPFNGPAGAFLRADNLMQDEEGVLALRSGSLKYNQTAFADLDVHSLFTATLGTTKHRLAGAGSHVYDNGTSLGVTFDGSGDIQFGSFKGQVLMARGTSKYKTDGTTVRNWGIAAPNAAPVLTALSPLRKFFALCDSGEAPGFTAEEGTITGTYPTGEDGTANGAIEVTPNATTGRATIIRTLAADTDYFTIAGYPGGDADVFDMSVFLTEPEKVETITIMIAVGSASDPFKDDYYQFDFRLGGARQSIVDMSEGMREAIERTIKFEDVGGKANRDAILALIETRREERAKERRDKGITAGWTRLSCLRAQFTRVGATAGRDWTKVRAIKVIYKASAGATGVARFDSITMNGASEDLALTGRFKLRYVFKRNFGDYVERSPASPESAAITLHGQPVRATIPAAAMAAKDPQATEVDIYIMGGALDRYYRAGTTAVTAGAGIRLDEFAKIADGTFNANDRTRLDLFEMSIPAVGVAGDLVVDILANEADILIENDFLDPDGVVPPDNIIDIEGPHFQRIFVLTSDGKLWPSALKNPGLLLTDSVIQIGDSTETVYWVKRAPGGIFVGTSKDIHAIRGSGELLDTGILNFAHEPLQVSSPPISDAVTAEGNNIIYLAADGWRNFNGADSIPIPRSDVDTLYKGKTRHGVSPINFSTGRFRAALSKGIFSAMTPEGGSTTRTSVLHRFYPERQKWFRHTYTPNWRCIYTEPDGTLLASDDAGFVWILDTGTQDHGVDIPVVLWTTRDHLGTPLNRKDPWDMLLEMDTGSRTATVELYLDASDVVAANGSFAVTATGHSIYKTKIDSVASFRHVQLRVSGSFPSFHLYSYSFDVWQRPQTRMHLDTGPTDVGKFELQWLREVRVKANSPSNLQIHVYLDGVLFTDPSATVVTANQVVVYPVPLGRGAKGSTVRVAIDTVATAGVGEVGFEIYWIELRFEMSGDQSSKPIMRIVPDQAA